jgi:zona occludens toxin
MLTLITGTPGAGKSLHAVWEFARKVPGSTIENNGVAVPRRLLSNVKDLLVDHEHIDAEAMNRWHEWAQPGDVILFDEVQEVWRPRAHGSKVPDCIAKLETHRHMGVDMVLITQHPNLIDANIRRLVNQHLHLRRLSRRMAYVYEWDHCANVGNVKTALQGRVWMHPRRAYALYKSAQLHTKPTARMPRLALFGVLALAGVGYLMPVAYGRITERFGSTASPTTQNAVVGPAKASGGASAGAGLPAPTMAQPLALPVKASGPVVQGCIRSAARCACFDDGGRVVAVEPALCEVSTYTVGGLVPLGGVDGPKAYGDRWEGYPTNQPKATEGKAGKDAPEGQASPDGVRDSGPTPGTPGHRALKDRTAAGAPTT